MLVYRSDIAGFNRDVDTGDIDGIVLDHMHSVLGQRVAESEVRSWRESLSQMFIVLSDPGIPRNAGVGIEFQIPQTAKRIDFLISGRDPEHRAQTVVVELKQWEAAEATAMDVVIEEHGFQMRWNLTEHGSGWLAHPDSINEIGCIHTVQGLELDYVGVIIGNDLVVEDGALVTRPEARSRNDRSIFGWKKHMREQPDETGPRLRRIILNTYRTLMTRGMKGCYIYATDPSVRQWLRQRMGAGE